MNATVLSYTKECNNFTKDDIELMECYSGKAAGVCYMQEPYMNSYVSDPEKSIRRFERVTKTGHHSVSDHTNISVLFEDIPKMTAMILNSFGFYNTSEKSGRYTIMKCDGIERQIYDKWLGLLYREIKLVDSNMEDKLAEKLAQENARYLLNVFTPSTTMMYTTTLRMWSYIRQWLKEYLELENYEKQSSFDKQLNICMHDLYNMIDSIGCYSDKIIDNKNRKINFLSYQTKFKINSCEESYQDSYLIKYKCSLASLAQLQRHRTLHYYMYFNGFGNIKYYIPPIVENNDSLNQEWLDDIKILKESDPCYFPQATLVDVVETGTIDYFMDKCDERLCGRVQLETFKNVVTNLYKFARQWRKSEFMQSQLRRHINDGSLIMKCGNTVCKEPCYWGPIKSQTKII